MFSVGERSVHASWVPPLIQDHNGPITHYEIQFIQSQFDSIPNVVIQTTNLSISYFDLEEFTHYVIIVAAATSTGVGPFSSPVNFITHQAGTPFFYNV